MALNNLVVCWAGPAPEVNGLLIRHSAALVKRDAMIAGNAEDLALRDGFAAPDWSRGHALPQFWFVGSTPSLAAFAFARSPFSLQVRGVMVDPADLEAV